MITDEVINCLVESYGYSYDYDEQMFYYGGLTIYSARTPSSRLRYSRFLKTKRTTRRTEKG